MKRLLVCLILTCLLAGCYNDDSEILSPIEYSRMMDNQYRHYRPIHWQHKEWTAAESGRTMTLKADDTRIRLSVRQNPPRIVIRQNGVIIGAVEKTEDGAVFVPVAKSTALAPTLICRGFPKLNLVSGDHAFALVFDENSASSANLQVNHIQGHKYSVSEKLPTVANEICTGTEIESPFSAAGTLIVHDEEIELPVRMAFAWFVTRFDTDCRRVAP